MEFGGRLSPRSDEEDNEQQEALSPAAKFLSVIFGASRFYFVAACGLTRLAGARHTSRVMRVMALDFGTKAIGVALSDELQLTARPLTTLRRGKLKFAAVLEHLATLAAEYEVGTLVIGLPLNMDGTRGPATSRVESFIAELKRHITIPIQTIDERLTSHEADDLLRARGAKQRERRAKSDEYAAMLILRDYLATQAN